jgi:VIT1/CCC1 family predicted Fe2+/Mn2+ transporter
MELYLRNIIFGIVDSLVSTVGLVAGIDVSGVPHSTVILTGIVYAFVEAFSMAVGSFLSEQSTEEYAAQGEVQGTKPFIGSVVMFVTFVIAAFVPLTPYFISQTDAALWGSIASSVVALFIVGLISARLAKVNLAKHALKTALLGGAAIVIGILVGKFVKAV